MKIEDREILSLISEGETREKGFLLLVKKYQQRLYWHIRRMIIDHDDTDDVLQNTFIKVWKGISKFRSDSGLYTWLYRIATNEALSFIKKNKRMQTQSLEESALRDQSYIDNETHYTGNEISLRLHKAVVSLPHKQQLVFNMKYFDELKYEEISEILGTSVGALKASYHLAVKKIEKQVLID